MSSVHILKLFWVLLLFSRLLQNATGETPDTDLDRIHDFVFDDTDGNHCIEELDINKFIRHTTTESSMTSVTHPAAVRQTNNGEDILLQQLLVNGNRTTVRHENIHGGLRPDGFSTAETSLQEQKTTSSVGTGEILSTCHLLSNSRQETAAVATDLHLTPRQDSCGTAAAISSTCPVHSSIQRKAYRARVISVNSLVDNDADEDDGEPPQVSIKYLARGAATSSTQLTITRGETGGACGAGDIVVVASDVPLDRWPSKGRTRHISESIAAVDHSPNHHRSNNHFPPSTHSTYNDHQRVSSLLSSSSPKPLVTLGSLQHRRVPHVIGEVARGIPVTSALVNSICHSQDNASHLRNCNYLENNDDKPCGHRSFSAIDMTLYPGVRVSQTTQSTKSLVASPWF